MAFFQKWKAHYKHKKFTSEDGMEVEDWGLEKTSNTKRNPTKKKNSEIVLTEDDSEVSNSYLETYEVKYLGCTPIKVKLSAKVTSKAIEAVMMNSKVSTRKDKKKCEKPVKLIVSPYGIEVVDQQTQNTVMRFSIYKISYCSVDAAFDHTFSFIGLEQDPVTNQENMCCYVFLCSKRKIAHEITLMLARCFEIAYQHWRDTVVQNVRNQSKNPIDSKPDSVNTNIINKSNVIDTINSIVEVHNFQSDKGKPEDDLLIDLAVGENNVQKYLQNTWVSFEEEDGLYSKG